MHLDHAAVHRRVLPVAADRAWDLVTDVHQHARWVPMTRIGAPTLLSVGETFVAVSGSTAPQGGPGLVDRMVVERLDPPVAAGAPGPATTGVARFRKVGPVLGGIAEIRVRPLGPALCEVTWIERITVRGVPAGLTDLVARPATGVMLRRVLGRVAAEVGTSAGT
ncbi:SRPBCC family protein [Actinotalea sp.]|uniref:SRPBCC family protein n=1 Tax=Actinotalea sp. TaxID=1872145 RepID=UPI002CA8F5B4|nr:SRPBCC family protein [Actinotalea sp.]HRA50980.1 SRPBCC family protein [Actinotalea sp.]